MGWAPSSWTATRYALTFTQTLLAAGVLGGVACGKVAQPSAPPLQTATGGQGQSGSFAGAGAPATVAVLDAGPAFACAPELQADPHNCGFSGHDCLGAVCASCTCAPAMLTSELQWSITSFAIDDSSLYLTTLGLGPDAGDGGPDGAGGAVLKCPLTGCVGSPTLLAGKQWYPQQLQLNASTLYWIDYNAASLMRCGVDCGDDAIALHSWSYLNAQGFAANATTLFFSDSRTGLILECGVGGCATPTTFASGQETPSELALAGDTLVWLNYGIYFVGPRKVEGYTDGGVAACPLAGCDGGPTALAASPGTSLVVNATTAYWVQGNEIVSCAVAGCNGAPSTFVSLSDSENEVGGLSLDESKLYFAVNDMSGAGFREVLSCSLDGCAGGPKPLFAEQYYSGPDSLQTAVDATRVYFLAGRGGRVAAVPK
jgi:hypothetical protein